MSPGLGVIYRWRMDPTLEAEGVAAWARVTAKLKAQRGALGSRLHRAEDGWWVAYAQWPDRATYDRSVAAGSIDPDASAVMARAFVEQDDPVFLEVHTDMLA